MKTLDRVHLAEICNASSTESNVRRAIQTLGRLSGWWLNDRAVEIARGLNDPTVVNLLSDSERLGSTRRACTIICTLQQELSLLKSAVYLPLEWKVNQPDCPSLPQPLRNLADEVRQAIASWRRPDLESAISWGLHPDKRLGLASLKLEDGIFASLRSGWVALAAGLTAAVYGFLPDPSVVASVDWSVEGGPLRVEYLKQKLALACSRNRPIEKFAVAESQRWESTELVRSLGSNLQVVPIAGENRGNSLDALTEFVSMYSSQPAKPNLLDTVDEQVKAFELCKKYYLLLTPFSPGAKKFYESHLLEQICKHCREKLLAAFGNQQVTHYVGVVSPSRELVVIGSLGNAVESALLLYTSGQEQNAYWCKEYLESRGVKRVQSTHIVSDVEAMIKAVETFLEPVVDRGKVVIDIKPGNKKMTYALIKAAGSDARVFCLQEEFRNDRRAEPGEEVPEFLQ